MRNSFFFLLFLVSFPLFGQQGNFSIELDAPENVIAGNDFEVILTFNKGDLKDYSRFSQELPAGFTAENIDSPNADFTFADQRVRIIWLKLPAEQEIVVKYAIRVNERLSGKLELSGTFAYVVNGERSYLNLPAPKIVNIQPNPEIDQSLVVDISEFPGLDKQALAAGGGEVNASRQFANVLRQKPVIENNGIVYVTMLVYPPKGTNYLKLEESVPGGYAFESIEKAGAVVSQAASIARFVWMNPPVDPMIIVKYRLVPLLEKEQEPVTIEGNLTYTEEGQTKVYSTREVDVNLAALSSAQQLEIMENGTLKEPVVEARKEKQKIEIPETHEVKEPAKSGAVSKKVKIPSSGIIEISQLDSQAGVYFRVQVAAVRNDYFVRTEFAGYDLLKNVKFEKINGWDKYTVGPFSSYTEAEAMKKKINSGTSVKNAFVVAYRDGKRIAMNEAL